MQDTFARTRTRPSVVSRYARDNSKETWKVINKIRGKQKVKIKHSFIIDGTLVEERRIIANGFNNFFTSIS